MRSLLVLPLLATLLSGCASGNKEEQLRASNSRRVDEMRSRALTRGEVASERGAQVLVIDQEKAFDIGHAMHGTSKTFAAGSAPTRTFLYDQKVAATGYRTRDFGGSKTSSFVDGKFATAPARTTGNYAIPNASKRADTKTAAVKEAREANRTLAVRTLPDGSRDFRGPEAARLRTGINPNEQDVGWKGNLQEMTIQDVRDLLNKNR